MPHRVVMQVSSRVNLQAGESPLRYTVDKVVVFFVRMRYHGAGAASMRIGSRSLKLGCWVLC